MEKVKMPWLEDLPVKAPMTEVFRPNGWAALATLKKHWPLPLLILILIAVFTLSSRDSTSEVGSEKYLEGISSRIPIFKGEILEPIALEALKVNRAQLTKHQAWNLLQLDVSQFEDGVRLKAIKDIAPMRPILWSEIKVLRSESALTDAPTSKKITIHYPSSKAKSEENP
jgi:hypothetical protein